MTSNRSVTAVAQTACNRRIAVIEPIVRKIGERTGFSLLTPLEIAASLQAAAGLSNRQIADHMHLSVRTVECHLQHVYEKLGVDTRHDLADVLGLRITVELVDSVCRGPLTNLVQ